MFKSLWRYSHLGLAVSSFLFLALLSITGIILSFDPIIERNKGFAMNNLNDIPVNQLIRESKKTFNDIQEIQVDDYGAVIVQYFNDNDEKISEYIDPTSVKTLGEVQPKSEFFEWATTLHRSLFLHETGRILIGLSAFLLLLITLSGIMLVIQRQKGIKRFFATTGNDKSIQNYHVIWGRIMLIFIVMISFTGSYLSYNRFIVPSEKVSLDIDGDTLEESEAIDIADFKSLAGIQLDQVKKIQFPLSEFPEDYFIIELDDKVLGINQFNGEIIQTKLFSKGYQLAKWSLDWHTGRRSIVWAIILGISCCYILFFIYSGFKITYNRLKGRAKNVYTAKEATIVILVGSENGSTHQFATSVYKQLIDTGHKVFIDLMDRYQSYPKAEQLIIFTCTYGDGDAPNGAKNFIGKLKKVNQNQNISYAIVGFGSRNYEHFCGFAYEVEDNLRGEFWATPQLDVHTIDDKSSQDFSNWLNEYSETTGFKLYLDESLYQHNKKHLSKLKVVEKTHLDENDTFIITLDTVGNNAFTSGDLLAIYPANDYRERLYSIGKVHNKIQLCIKKYENGLGSEFLYQLQKGDIIQGRMVNNQHFHFPKKAKKVVLISNGTGIAPFLGMIADNYKKVTTYLYCGFKTQSCFEHYQPILDKAVKENQLSYYKLALSREGDRQYVSHILNIDAKILEEVLQDKGYILLCGSMAMRRVVMIVLEAVCQENSWSLDQLIKEGRIISDCY